MVCPNCHRTAAYDSYFQKNTCRYCGWSEMLKQTNADRIRSMTDEELAQILVSEPIAETIPFCQNKPECERLLETASGIPESMCVECALDWLQQPVEVVNSD